MDKEQKKAILVNGVCITVLSCVTFAFLFYFAKEKTFWMDDIAQMDFSWQNSLGQMLQRLQDQDNTPPLTHVLTYLWIHMVPFGTRNLKLFNIIFTILGFVECYRLATILRDRIAGVMTYVIGATSVNFIMITAYTFRPYGVLFYLVALCYRLFCKCQMEPEKGKIRVVYTLLIIALLYTHYFGALVLLCMGIADLAFSVREKKRLKSLLLSYFVAGVSFLPWIVLMLKRSITRLEQFWPPVPTMESIFYTIKIMFSFRTVAVIVLWIGLLLPCCQIIFRLADKQERELANKKKRKVVAKKKQEDEKASDERMEMLRLKLVMVSQIIWIAVLFVVFVFSVSSKRFGSLYVDRYFVSVAPFLFLGFGYCVSFMIQVIYGVLLAPKGHRKRGSLTREQRTGKAALQIVCAGIVVLICYVPFGKQLSLVSSQAAEPYEKCSDYLLQQSGIYDADTMVFCTNYDLARGWEYYWTKKGQLEQTPQIAYYTLAPEQLADKNTVYVTILHTSFSQQTQDVLAQNGFVPDSQHESLPIVKYVRQ